MEEFDMKKTLWSIFFMCIISCFVSLTYASCPTNHAIQHDGAGAITVQCLPSASCLHTPRYWCLSGGSSNNNGSSTAWWQQYSGTLWWFNGSWADAGVNGCCGMWDVASFDSRTMMAVVEIAYNEGAATHAGYVNVEVKERPTAGTDYFFTRSNNIASAPIPVPAIANVTTTGLGGTSTFNVTGWKTGANIDYWVRLENGTTGNDLSLNARCTPSGTGACPAPIAGYQIVAIYANCADGTCDTTTDAPAPPTTSAVSSWNLTVTNGYLSGRTPTFPLNNVQVANPSTNGYIYVATRMAYADNFAGVYTSGNGLAWRIGPLGAEISNLSASYVQTGLVKVSWKSVVEGNVAGYNVYRSFSPTGTFSKVNARTIPVTGNEGSTYTFKDRVTSTMPRNVYYKIEIVRPNGQTEMVQDVAVANANPRRLPKL